MNLLRATRGEGPCPRQNRYCFKTSNQGEVAQMNLESKSFFPRRKLVQNVIFSLLPTVLLFGLSEGALRLLDFKYSETPLEVRSFAESVQSAKYGDEITRNRVSVIVKDEKQFWKPVESFEGHYPVQKAAGTLRIATLGCSCTQACSDTTDSYPSLMEKLLRVRTKKQVEVLNAGVGSYSSYQGLQRLKYAVTPYRPDIVTIYFGWNEHWMAYMPDHEIKLQPRWVVRLLNFAERFRTYKFLNSLSDKLASRWTQQKGERLLGLRVPPENYSQNLTAIISHARSHQMFPVLITAPSDETQLKPFYNFPFPKEKLAAIHRDYNEIVRQVGAQQNVPVIDLEKIIRQLMSHKDMPKIFSDGIHFTPFGCKLVAQVLSQQLIDAGIVNL